MNIQTQKMQKVQTSTKAINKSQSTTKRIAKTPVQVRNTRLTMLLISLLAIFMITNYTQNVKENNALEEVKINEKKIEEEKADRLAKVNDENAKKTIDYTKVKLREENNLNVG